MSLPVLIISGTIGAGKTTVGLAAQEVLEKQQIPHAYLDLDRLGDSYPRVGRFNEDVIYGALSAIWPVYKAFGAQRLLLSHVVEKREELERYRQALGPCSVTVVLLKSAESGRVNRIQSREFGESLKWHLKRTVELDQILSNSNVHDFEVQNDAREPQQTAIEVLEKAGWITANGGANQHGL